MSLIEKAKSKRKKCTRIEVTKAHFDLCVAWIKEEVTLSQVSYALDLKNAGGKDALVAIASILKESYYKKWFHLLKPLSGEARKEREPTLSPDILMGALQDNIQTETNRIRSVKSTKSKGLL